MPGRVVRAVCTGALAALLAASPATADTAEPGTTADPGGIAGLLTRLQALYRQAEAASETYNATAEELRKRTAQADRLSAALARARGALDTSRRDMGRLAREQYQGRSDFSAYMRLLLSDDPQDALEQAHVIERLAAGRAAAMDRLTGSEKRADELATRSRAVLDRQQVLAARQKRQRDTVRSRLARVEALLASLSPGQLAELAALERKNTGEAQHKLVSSGALGSAQVPSEQGSKAVR